MPIHPVSSLEGPQLVDALSGASPVLLFKHSPSCGASFRALEEVSEFAAAHPEVPVLVVDVVHQRALSDRLAANLGVRHESPQAIVVRGGKALWNESHRRLSHAVLVAALARAWGTDAVSPSVPLSHAYN